MNEYMYAMASLPIIFLDWQVGFVWAFSLLIPNFIPLLGTMDYSGLEVWVIFCAVAFVRRWMLR